MNDTILILWTDQDLYFFDVQTGIRYTDVIEIPGTQIGYDNITNTFWYYCRERNKHSLKSFKIEGFMSTAESQNQKKAANSKKKLNSDRIREIFKDLDESQQVVESDMSLFVKSLWKDPGP